MGNRASIASSNDDTRNARSISNLATVRTIDAWELSIKHLIVAVAVKFFTMISAMSVVMQRSLTFVYLVSISAHLRTESSHLVMCYRLLVQKWEE